MTQTIPNLQETTLVAPPVTDPRAYALFLKWRALDSLYFFSKVIFGYDQLTTGLHLPLCNRLQRYLDKLVIEFPRGHFKTTVASKSFPAWRALPMEPEVVDEALLNGWWDEARVAELQQLHNPNIRVLIISSIDTNAKKILRSIRYQFESNKMFRALWPELMPTERCRWTDNELEITRTERYSESTFEAVGVGSALQSRHYDLMIEDDLVGLEAIKSETVMRGVIDYHILLEGAYDRPDRGESLVIGNRWSFNDLNSWIKNNETEYTVLTRSAIEDGQPIFPERFSIEGFERIKKKQGFYFFSCQYLNNPIAPGAHDFEPEWLRRHKYVEELQPDSTKLVRLEREDGRQVTLGQLNKYLLIDPAREGKHSNMRHAIICCGIDKEENIWILRAWADNCSTDKMLRKAFELYEQFKCVRTGIEGYGGDEHLKNYMNYMARAENKRMNIVVFSKSTRNSKEERIRSSQPLFELGKVSVPEGDIDFTLEYVQFPSGQTVDLLDAFSHGPEVWRRPISDNEEDQIRRLHQRLLSAIDDTTGY